MVSGETIHRQTLAELAQGLSAGEFTSRELTEILLRRIESHQESYNAFITITADIALQQADKADKARANGGGGYLNGLPIVHKDLFCTKGVRATCGSRMLQNFV